MIVRRLLRLLAIGLLAAPFITSALGNNAETQEVTSDENARNIEPQAFRAVQNAEGYSTGERTRGIELYRQGKFSEASKLLQKAVKLAPVDHEAWYYLGLAFYRQPKKLKDAVKAFETAVKLRPDFAAAYTALAATQLRRNKTSEAVRNARTALGIDPSLAEPHYIIGHTHLDSGELEEALTEAEESIRLDPELAPPYLLKSKAIVSINTRGRSLSVITPHRPPTTEQLAERHERRLKSSARYKEAAESLETYLRLSPSNSSAEFWRAQLATLKYYASYTGDESDSDERPYPSDELTTKARVLKKPEPMYTESARGAQVTGTVVLRAVFSSDGTVKHILVLAGLPHGLTEASIKAAQKIKFIPATKDGRTVSMFIQLEYNFNLY